MLNPDIFPFLLNKELIRLTLVLGRSAIIVALSSGQIPVVQVLLEKGIKLAMPSTTGSNSSREYLLREAFREGEGMVDLSWIGGLWTMTLKVRRPKRRCYLQLART
jgi:hypothetical protein